MEERSSECQLYRGMPGEAFVLLTRAICPYTTESAPYIRGTMMAPHKDIRFLDKMGIYWLDISPLKVGSFLVGSFSWKTRFIYTLNVTLYVTGALKWIIILAKHDSDQVILTSPCFLCFTFILLTLQVAIVGLCGSDWTGDAAIDDITLTQGPCSEPGQCASKHHRCCDAFALASSDP